MVFALDRITDLVFLFDIGVNFRSAWANSDGVVVFDGQQAAAKYLRSSFFIDFISIIPMDFLAGALNYGQSGALRLPKLLKMFRLFKIMKVLVRKHTLVSL